MLSTKQSDNFFMSKIKRSERLMSINTFDKTWIVWNAAPEFIWISSIDPPPPPPFTSFRPPVLREKLYIVILLNSDNSLVYTLSSYWVVHFHAPSAFYVVLICLYLRILSCLTCRPATRNAYVCFSQIQKLIYFFPNFNVSESYVLNYKISYLIFWTM